MARLFTSGVWRTVFHDRICQLHYVHIQMPFFQYKVFTLHIALRGKFLRIILIPDVLAPAIDMIGQWVASGVIDIGNFERTACAVQPHGAPRIASAATHI